LEQKTVKQEAQSLITENQQEAAPVVPDETSKRAGETNKIPGTIFTIGLAFLGFGCWRLRRQIQAGFHEFKNKYPQPLAQTKVKELTRLK
jgi:hypothetical protein